MNLKTMIRKTRRGGRDPVLTIRSGIHKLTPETLAKFKENLAYILTTAKPSFAAIEGNETSLIPGTMSLRSYSKLLQTSLEVSSQTSTKCVNGGIESGALLTAYYTEWAEQADGDSLLSRLDENEKRFLTDNTYKEERERTTRTVVALLEGYQKMGLGYVNLHWNTYPIDIFIKLADLINREYGLEIISTEMEVPVNPERHESTLRSVKDLNLDCVIWYFPYEGRYSKAIFRDDSLTKLSKPLRDINRSLF